MRTPKFTPGPWKSFRLETNRDEGVLIFAQNKPLVIGHDLSNADAALIAAAPDLFNCLCSVIDAFGPEDEDLSGGDLIDWMGQQIPHWKRIVRKATKGKP